MQVVLARARVCVCVCVCVCVVRVLFMLSGAYFHSFILSFMHSLVVYILSFKHNFIHTFIYHSPWRKHKIKPLIVIHIRQVSAFHIIFIKCIFRSNYDIVCDKKEFCKTMYIWI